MKKYPLFILSCLAVLFAQDIQAQQAPKKPQNPSNSISQPINVGVVNFKKAVEDSNLGKAEQAAFESLKSQMATVLEKSEKELDDIASKLNDPDHVDGLSPQAEEELKTRFQKLSQEMTRYQNQYYQILNQANYKVIYSLTSKVAESAEVVAKDKSLNLVLNEEACFYYGPSLDITQLVIAEMDKRFAADSKTSLQEAAPSAPHNGSAPQ